MKIWANTIVYNEDKFIWFALMSVIDYVDKILVYDTGSTDNTVAIIKEVEKKYPKKIIFKEVGKVSRDQYTQVRQYMLNHSECDWIMILDGDEVWGEKSIKEVIQTIRGKGKSWDGIVVPFYVFLGDIYHYQEERAGQYELLGRKGHLSLRFINRKVPGLHVDLPYGKEGYYDGSNISVDKREAVVFIQAPYLHATHLIRSSQKRGDLKFKYELGIPFPKNFDLPRIFWGERPKIVADPTLKSNLSFLLPASVLTLPRKIKRRIKKR